jgi:hypothetical protein
MYVGIYRHRGYLNLESDNFDQNSRMKSPEMCKCSSSCKDRRRFRVAADPTEWLGL